MDELLPFFSKKLQNEKQRAIMKRKWGGTVNNGVLIGLILVLLLIWRQAKVKKRRAATVRTMQKRKTERERTAMHELAKRFIGKECLVYTMASESTAVKGTVTEVSDSGLLVENDGHVQAVNLEYVVRIQEWPRNAKGKKKQIFA